MTRARLTPPARGLWQGPSGGGRRFYAFSGRALKVAVVGCGYIADFYIKNFASYPELELVGVSDRDKNRADIGSRYHRVPAYRSLKDLLKNSGADIVLNLTNPASHFAVTKACLEAGKHVYTEKPMTLDMAGAEELVELAEKKGLYLAASPSSLLGETAQTLWKALRQGMIGRVRLAYAEIEAGPTFRKSFDLWRNDSGAAWPYKDEFEVGCVREHAAYSITWLAAFFGPAKTVAAFSACLVPRKGETEPVRARGSDFSVAVVTFSSGTVARLTFGSIAAEDRSLRLFGDKGALRAADVWDYRSPIDFDLTPVAIDRHGENGKRGASRLKGDHPLLKTGEARRIPHPYGHQFAVDFLRGVAELAAAIRERRACRLSARFSLHVDEVVWAIEDARRTGASRRIKSSFKAIDPMPWAR